MEANMFDGIKKYIKTFKLHQKLNADTQNIADFVGPIK